MFCPWAGRGISERKSVYNGKATRFARHRSEILRRGLRVAHGQNMETARSCLQKQRSDKETLISEEDNDNDKYKNKYKDNDSLSSGGAGAPEEREKRPTLEEVLRFSQEEGLTTDVDYFYNYYEANGWRIGKYPIRDWRAALRAWARKAPSAGSAPKPENSVGDNFRIAMEMMKQKEAKQCGGVDGIGAVMYNQTQ